LEHLKGFMVVFWLTSMFVEDKPVRLKHHHALDAAEVVKRGEEAFQHGFTYTLG
jgi:hypothetical protein